MSRSWIAAGLPQKDGSRNFSHALIDFRRESIYSCAVCPGDKLSSEAMLPKEYGVSCGVVRETIMSLKASGLIEKCQGIVRLCAPSSVILNYV